MRNWPMRHLNNATVCPFFEGTENNEFLTKGSMKQKKKSKLYQRLATIRNNKVKLEMGFVHA